MKQLTNTLKRITIALTLLSLLVPTTLTLINVKAQEINNKQIDIEITKKDGSTEIKTTTTDELALNPIVELSQEKLPQIELNPNQIQELETSGAIVYDENNFATLNLSVLKELGYSQNEIEELEKMRDNYNSIPVKEVKATTKSQDDKISFNVNVSAACEYEHRTTWHMTHAEIWMNSCVIQSIKLGRLVGESAAFLFGLAKGLTLTPIGAIVALYIHIYIEVLDIKDSECSNNGANLNVPYVSSTLMWVSSVC